MKSILTVPDMKAIKSMVSDTESGAFTTVTEEFIMENGEKTICLAMESSIIPQGLKLMMDNGKTTLSTGLDDYTMKTQKFWPPNSISPTLIMCRSIGLSIKANSGAT